MIQKTEVWDQTKFIYTICWLKPLKLKSKGEKMKARLISSL